MTSQGNGCIKFFRVKYELDEHKDRTQTAAIPTSEKKSNRNRKRAARRIVKRRYVQEELRQDPAATEAGENKPQEMEV